MKLRMRAFLVGASLVSGLALAPAAGANPLTLTGDWTGNGQNLSYDNTLTRGTFTCASSCQGLVTDTASQFFGAKADGLPTLTSGTESWSGSVADMFYLSNSGSAGEIAWVTAALAGLTPSETPGSNSGQLAISGGGNQFTTNALYILLKIGNDPQYALIKNTSGGSQTYTYGGTTGLSHYVVFGATDGGGGEEIPEPAGIALLGLGLAGLAIARRRKQQ